MISVLAAVAAVLACSPLLAAWTVALTAGVQNRWWTVTAAPGAQWATVTVVAGLICAVAVHGAPALTWWLYAACGAVLVVVDVRTHTLPARMVGPWLCVLAGSLVLAAIVDDAPHRLARACLAAALVGGGWLLVVLIAPALTGVGDVLVSTAGALVLGWSSWGAVGAGQLLIWLVAPLVVLGEWVAHPARRGRGMAVPMGPALVAATVLAAWV